MYSITNQNYKGKINSNGKTLSEFSTIWDGKLYYKPRMVVVAYEDKKILIFNSFKIRIMGKGENHRDILRNTFKAYDIELMSMTVKIDLGFSINLHKQYHNKIINTLELFPALNLRTHNKIHVNIFASGKCILTGVRHILDIYLIRLKLLKYINKD